MVYDLHKSIVLKLEMHYGQSLFATPKCMYNYQQAS